MKVGLIDQEQWPLFAPLLLPIVTKALEHGDAVAVLGLTEEDVACGAVAYYMDGNRLEIISFYVAPDYRGRGGGTLLLTTLARLARKGPAPAYEIALDFSSTHEEHEALIHFLEHMGYQQRPTHNGNYYYMTLAQMLASPYRQPVKKLPSNVVPLRQLDSTELHMLQHHAAQNGTWIPVQSLSAPEVEQDVSCAIVKYDTPVALLLFSYSESRLILSCTWDKEHKAEHLPLMLRYALWELNRKYPPETPLAVHAVRGIGEDLIRKLVPDAHPISVCYYRTLD